MVVNRQNVALAGLCGVMLAACAGQQGVKQAEEVSQHCARLYADPRIDPIRSKMLIPISVTEAQDIQILANRERPTPAEREALLVLADARIACNKFSYERLGPPPAYRSSTQDRVTASLADLYAGEITYGEFAKTLLFIGERDKIAAEDLEEAYRERERWRDVNYSN
jgi:hypothetical protein